MSVRAVRAFAVAFFVLYAVALTWPGAVPFNRVLPLVLGLPFNLAWGALWIVAGGLVLWWLDRSEARVRGSGAAAGSGDRGPVAGSGDRGPAAGSGDRARDEV